MFLAASLIVRNPGRFGLAVLGGAAVGAALVVTYVLRPGIIGFGDVRLVTLNGLLAGWWGLAWSWWALFAGAFLMLPVALAKSIMTAWRASAQPGLPVTQEKPTATKSGSEDGSAGTPKGSSETLCEAEDGGNDFDYPEPDDGQQPQGRLGAFFKALVKGERTTLRAGPWLCAGTAAVVIIRWVQAGAV